MEGALTTGSLLKRSISVLRTGLGPFISLALIVQIPTLVAGLAPVLWMDSADLEEPDLPFATTILAITIFTLFLFQLLTTLATATIVPGVFQILRGAPLEIGEYLRGVAARWLEVIGLAILVFLAVWGGMLLCVIPGIVINCGLFVAVPALLGEQLRVTEAMKRSWSLTSGYKLAIFFVLLAIGLFGMVPTGISALLSLTALGGTLTGGLIPTFLEYGFAGIVTAISAVAAAVAYHDLCVVREGASQ
jgi:hypothetical protein